MIGSSEEQEEVVVVVVMEVTGHFGDKIAAVDKAFEDAIVVEEEMALSHCFRCTDSN
ncbi:MAG: hypothetical protein QWI73_07225 [Alphaproteobacteria bacterium]|nr:hypothetical protein [Alphaproteobacteria bacterium]